MQKEKRLIHFHQPDIGREELSEIKKVFSTGWLTRGALTREFEEKFANFIGAKYALATSSCTSAIELALRVIGISYGDEVIVSPLSFVSPINAVVRLGGRAKFVDVREDTFCLDEEKIESAISSKTKAIICVHFGSSFCNMLEIVKIAKKHGLFLIEDCAHAFPAEIFGKHSGLFSDFACFSFYPTKGITTIEGGMLVTKRKSHLEQAKAWHLHGIAKSYSRNTPASNYDVVLPGYKFNFTDVQSAIGLVQLKRAWQNAEIRKEIALEYEREFSKIDGLMFQRKLSNSKSSYHLFPLVLTDNNLASKRDRIILELYRRGVECSVHYKPIHLMSYYQKLLDYRKGDFPVAEKIGRGEISLPIYHLLTKVEVKRVIREFKKILANFT